MGRRSTCPYCGSTETANKGFRKTKTLGIRVLKRCITCKRKFTPKHQPLTSESDEADGVGPAGEAEPAKYPAKSQETERETGAPIVDSRPAPVHDQIDPPEMDPAPVTDDRA